MMKQNSGQREQLSNEASRSLEMLDDVIKEFETEFANVSHTTVKRRSRSISPKTRSRHEDIRRSLEVLDSVLAEFDDCCDSWDPQIALVENGVLPGDSLKDQRYGEEDEIEYRFADSPCYENVLCKTPTPDGETSHISTSTVEGQAKIQSPPPIPKRSPATRLSDRNSGIFNFDSASSGSCESTKPSSAADNEQVEAIGRLSFEADVTEQNDDVFNASNDSNADAPSVMKRRQMFEHKIIEAKLSASKSPLLSRKDVTAKSECEGGGLKSSPSFLKRSVDSGINSSKSPSPAHIPTTEDTVGNNSAVQVDDSKDEADEESAGESENDSPNECCCKERIRQLHVEFAQAFRLLKLNQIKGFDATNYPLNVRHRNIDGYCCDEVRELRENAHTNCIVEENPVQDDELSQSPQVSLSETIEDLPKLLPTDALNRPQLGLSYSLEEDLSPGIKEIRQTSTPKSESFTSFRGSPSGIKEPMSLSTFSHSSSSLGYVSSQSDLELNAASTPGSNKVPLSTLKSQTLPIGAHLTPSPFYSDNGPYNNGSTHISSKGSHSDLELRSSSAPPPLLEVPVPKKKHHRVFSRKEKKKNEDNLSVKSDLSFDEGIILKKVEALDGAADISTAEKKEPVEEKKRRSVWKSILRRK